MEYRNPSILPLPKVWRSKSVLRARQKVIGIRVLAYRACFIDGCLIGGICLIACGGLVIGSWLILNATLILRDRLVYRGWLNLISASKDATDIR
jgi:hypothetical protein